MLISQGILVESNCTLCGRYRNLLCVGARISDRVWSFLQQHAHTWTSNVLRPSVIGNRRA